jgi:hypothetical protein
MKKLILLSLILVLTACTSATEVPSAAPTDVPPTTTPVVVVQTVVVEATQASTEIPPTPVPTNVPPTAAVVTVVVEATQVPATQAPAEQPASNGLTMVDNVLGAGWFVDMTRNSSQLSLRCQLYKEIKFSVKPTDKNITQVQFYYRIEDRSTGATFDWQNFGKMIAETDGTFTLAFNGEQVNADSRRPNAWLDYQFVGLSQTGGVVGRSDKIEKQITYTFECP